MDKSRIIVDVREPFEYDSGHASGAINIPLSLIANGTDKLAGLPKDSEIILYCNSGNRSNIALNLLKQQGYTNLINGINKDRVAAEYEL